MSIDNANESVDMTTIKTPENRKPSILPPALLAAKVLNKRNKIGTMEVTLPVLNTGVTCSAIAGVDDASIKSMSGSISAYTEANFRLLYKQLEFSPDSGINSYEEFISKITEADFRTLLFGVVNSSFKTLESSNFICKNETCPNPDPKKVFSFTPTVKDIKIEFTKENYVSPSGNPMNDLFIGEKDNLKIYYKFDSIANKIRLLKRKTNEEVRNNLVNYGLLLPKTELVINYIDSVEVTDEGETFTISHPEDILLFINSLDITSREEIEDLNSKYINHIDSWIPEFSTTIKCPHCQQTQQWEDIDLYVEFFRKFTIIFK